MNQESVNYVKAQLTAGRSLDQVKESLRSSGWEEADIEQTLQMVGHDPVLPRDNQFPQGVMRYGWSQAKQHWSALLPVWFLCALVYAVGFATDQPHFFELPKSTVTIINICVAIVGIFLALGLVKVGLNIVDGKPFGLGDLMTSISKVLKYLAAAILTFIVTLLGFILLIVPGVYAAMRLQLTIYFIVDQNQGPIQAMRSSWRATKGHVLSFLGYFVKAGLVTYLFFLPVYAGLILVTMEQPIGYIVMMFSLLTVFPITAFWLIGMASIYRKLGSLN